MKFPSCFKILASLMIIGGMVWAVGLPAGAAPKMGHFPFGRGHFAPTATCSGTFESPGVLAGTYSSNVVVSGICFVNGGAATIDGNLTVSSGGALVAAFAENDAGSGAPSLTVLGNVLVQSDGTALIGCEPNYFQCLDDPSTTGGTLTGQNHIYGSILGIQSLGVIVHATTIGGNVTEIGGGGGDNCNIPTSGPFSDFGSQVYSDYEDNSIGGNLTILGIQTCWMGSLRNTVRGSITDIGNTMADPDAGEVVQNTVDQNLVCFDNSPAIQFGDSGGSSNLVYGQAVGECAFNLLLPDENFGSGGSQPISVKE